MRFQDSRVQFSLIDALMIIGSLFAAVLLLIPTWGVSILVVILLWFGRYKYEKQQEILMRQQAERLRNVLDAVRERLRSLESYDSYLPKRDREVLEVPMKQVIGSLANLPSKYDDLWLPIMDESSSWVKFLKMYNLEYIQEQKKRHSEFFSGQLYHNGHAFNEKQIEAILTNDYNNLVVAGPGAGKTRVLTSRVALFANHRNVPEERILVMAFNNNAIDEISGRLRERFGIWSADVTTFHKLGMRILRETNQLHGRNPVEARAEFVIGKIIDKLIEEDPAFQATYLNYIRMWEVSEDTVQTDSRHVDEQLRSKSQEFYRTIDGIAVKSLAERDIANFFLQHGIHYEYEKEVDWCDKDSISPNRTYCPDFYLSDIDVYLEHWGITDDGKTPNYYTQEASERYREVMLWKRSQFEKHGKMLWETNHSMFAEKRLILELKKMLNDIGIQPIPLDYLSILEKAGLKTHSSDLVRKLIINAVGTSKIYGFNSSSLGEHIRNIDLRKKEKSVASVFILDLVLEVFERYEKHLETKKKIDFEDMINKAILQLKSFHVDSASIPVGPYDMIFVDEFQDISYQRLKLIQELQRLNPECRLFCVGDDWQAIYGFAGSSAAYTIQFSKWFASPVRVDLVENYRNPHEILDFAVEIIHRCSRKLEKNLQPREAKNETAQNPMIFKRIRCKDEFSFRRKQNKEVVGFIESLIGAGAKPSEIMILSRIKFGYANLQELCKQRSNIPIQIRKKGIVVRQGISFSSIHMSKGLEADYVIVLNVFKGLYGFPLEFSSKISFEIINPDLPKPLDEERRLLFVAATRAKKQCIVFTQYENESEFLKENRCFQSHFSPRLQHPFKGRIVQEREMAYEVEVPLSPSYCPRIWIPKSKILQISTESKDGLLTFQLEEWLYKRKFDELHVDSYPLRI